jgi:hypothetical protein
VASDPTVHVAAPSPPGHRPVNTGSRPGSAELSVTDTPDTGPFSADTCTVNDTAWPGSTLDPEFWTLTHSSTGVGAEDGASTVAEGEEAGDVDGEGVTEVGSGWHAESTADAAVSTAVAG